MGREATYYGRLNPSNNTLFLPFYGVSNCAVNIIRVDNANNTGNIYAQNIIPKVWDYEASIFQSDAPTALYGFASVQQPGDPQFSFSLSTASVAVEMGAGGAIALAGGTLQTSTLPVTRLQGKSWMVPPAVQATHVFTTITARENAGLPWSVEGWVFRSASSGAAILYIETNAGITSYIEIQMSAAGILSLIKSGVTSWTGIVAVPLAAWTHFAIVSNGTQITQMLSSGTSAAVAYTHATGLTSDRTVLNLSGLGQHYTANVTTYQSALTAAQFNRHEGQVAGIDYFSGGVLSQGGSLGQGGSVQIIFTNDAIAGFVNPSLGVWAMLLPLQGIGLVQSVGVGEYVYEIHTEELDV